MIERVAMKLSRLPPTINFCTFFFWHSHFYLLQQPSELIWNNLILANFGSTLLELVLNSISCRFSHYFVFSPRSYEVSLKLKVLEHLRTIHVRLTKPSHPFKIYETISYFWQKLMPYMQIRMSGCSTKADQVPLRQQNKCPTNADQALSEQCIGLHEWLIKCLYIQPIQIRDHSIVQYGRYGLRD